MNNANGFPVEITALPAINQIIWEAEEKLKILCGTDVSILIRMPKKEEVTILTIQQQVCEAFDVSWSEIQGRSRKGRIPKARFAYCWLCKQYLRMSLKDIGNTLGGRDHTTIIHAIQTAKDLVDTKDVLMLPMLRIVEESLKFHNPKTPN